jgi:hypothetical protein
MWGRVIGAAAARRALPMWAGVGVVAAILFGGHAMMPSDLTYLARDDRRVGIAIAAMWIVLVAPVGAAIVDPRPTAWLRALPSSRVGRWIVTFAIAMIAQLPWAILWWLGVGPAAGLGAAIAAAIVMLVAGSARWPLPARAPRWRTGVGALAGVHARALVRTRGPAIARAIAWALCGGATAGLVVRANQLDALVPMLVAVAIAAPMGLTGLAAPVADSDRAIAWATLAASRAARASAQAIALGGCGALLGAIAGLAAILVGSFDARALLGAIGLGAALGACATRVGAWSLRGAEIDGTRVVVGMACAAIAASLAVGALGAWAIAGAAAVAAGLVAPMAGAS